MRKRSNRPFAVTAALVVAAASLGRRPAVADPPGTNYRLAFTDEFNGASLDLSKWSAASPGWTMPNSASTASAGMVSIGNGVATLSATRNGSSNAFTSGSISSYTKYNFTGGYVEARIQLPSTPGSWPAFWGLYNGWPPEADIMEYPLTSNGGSTGLRNNQFNTNYHYTNSSGNAAAGAGVVTAAQSLAGAWHTFGMNWISSSSMAFYLDGQQVQSYTGSSVAQMASMYMILDYAVGGWPGTPSLTQWGPNFTDQTKVDWVRVWQTNPNGDAATTWNVNGGGAWGTAANWATGNVPARSNTVAVFGRVGTAATANVSTSAWHVLGGITFDGAASGTTAYTIGTSASQLQLANSAGAVVQATSLSTANQNVNARVELWSNTTVHNDMTGGQTLNLNGGVSGNGALTVDGVGTVILSGVGSFTGGTTIGSGQGPAVLRANAESALGTAPVVIGAAGNATTARLELTGGHTLPNTIDFRGRNNPSVGIENLSGNNTIAGTISATVGGSVYQIQSDVGALTLSGAASAGVALQANASGSRTFTLQGVGNGTIGGSVQNGSGTVSIVKAGSGVWTLAGANTYTGSTTVNAGTLAVTRSLATSTGVTVNAGGTFEAAAGQTVKQLVLNTGAAARITVGPAVKVLTVGDNTHTFADPAASALTTSGTGQLDLTNNAVVVDYAPGSDASALGTVRAKILSGYNGGNWNGAGITSTTAAANSGSLGVGYAPASDLLGPTGGAYLGTTVDGSAVLARETLLGDATLDGAVDFNDLVKLAQNYNVTDGTRTWATGDFTYDGNVDFNDLVKLAQNYNAAAAAPTSAIPGAPADFQADLTAAFAAVPEPGATALGTLALAAVSSFRRRRRR